MSVPEGREVQDGPLAEAARGGDREAFGALVRRHEGWILNLMLARLGDRGEAEEGAQEAFVRAFSALASLREPGAFRGWLRTTAERVASDLGARRSRAPSRDPVGEPSAPAPSPLEAGERRAAVARAVEALEEGTREVVILRYDGGLSCAQIARELGITPAAVSMRLHRAHQELALSLAGWGGRA